LTTARSRLAGFLGRYSPAVRRIAANALVRLRKRVPGAIEMVYDNYNALVIGFSPTERPSDALFSIVLYPNYVRLFFLDGASLDDPEDLLQGSGRLVRSIRLVPDASVIDRPAVRALIAQAIAASDVPFDRRQRRTLVIRSVSAKQRPRRARSR
jgi:hypothetical protein